MTPGKGRAKPGYMTNYDPIPDLVALLDLEQIEDDRFRGIGHGGETYSRIFGGQVVAQALTAAYGTVEGRAAHSLHAYFIRPGAISEPVEYQVTRARDGGSFTTRHVSAIQKGEEILSLTASFQKDEPGYDYHWPMPEATDPEDLQTRAERRAWLASQVPESYRDQVLRPSAIEVREVDPRDPFKAEVADDANCLWFRLSRPLELNPVQQQITLAYASDLHLLSSGMRRVGDSFYTGRIMSASLDHSIWFHRQINMNDWNLYVMDSPNVHGSRSLNRGLVYDKSGSLVASTVQEGLQRIRRRPGL